MDIFIPSVLVYVYLANLLKTGKRESVDPREMKANMDSMMSNMLLPIAFYLFCRKLLG